MRSSDYIGTSLRDIRRQPVRAGLTIIALAISSSLFVALVTLGLQTRDAIVKQIGQDTAVSAIVVTSNTSVGSGFFGSSVQVASSSNNKLDDSVVQKLAALASVQSATPVVAIGEFKEFTVAGYDRAFVAKTNAVDPTETSLYKLAAGNKFSRDDAHEVILGSGYAKALGAENNPSSLVGKTVRIKTYNGYRGDGATIPRLNATKSEQAAFAATPSYIDATIAGVTDSSRNDNLIFIPLGWGHQIESPQVWSSGVLTSEDLIVKNGYASIVVQAKSSAAVKPITRAIENLGYGTTSKQKQIDQINQLSTVMWVVLGSIALISLISASLGIVNTMLMAVSEQKYSIGVWRACGATRSMIARMFLLQASILGIIGGVLGTCAGAFVSGYINGKIAAILHAQGLDAITIAAPSIKLLAASILLTTALAVLAGLYPAYRAARNIYV